VTADVALRLAYGFNIAVLAPVLVALYRHQGPGVVSAIGGGIANSDGLRLLVGSLWLAVLLMSVAGLVVTRPFVALLAFQVVYKAIYLGTYVIPVGLARGWDAIPAGPAAVFAFIVVVWPFVIWRAWS
jgi:hypothetical protein